MSIINWQRLAEISQSPTEPLSAVGILLLSIGSLSLPFLPQKQVNRYFTPVLIAILSIAVILWLFGVLGPDEQCRADPDACHEDQAPG